MCLCQKSLFSFRGRVRPNSRLFKQQNLQYIWIQTIRNKIVMKGLQLSQKNQTIKFFKLLLLICILVQSRSKPILQNADYSKSIMTDSETSLKFEQLQLMLQTMNQNFIEEFLKFYSQERVMSLTDKQNGQYLFLLGKMYLYNVVPETEQYQTRSRYILAYHYLKIAAQVFQNPQAYYYLAILQYLKINPSMAIYHNLKNDSQFLALQDAETYLQDLKTRHLHNIEHNLYLASLLGSIPASISLGYMLKEGIATSKNCTSALGYYLYAMKQTKIDSFQFPSEINDTRNFQKEIYCQNFEPKFLDQSKVELAGQWSVIKDNLGNFDTATLEQIALNYHYGRGSYPVDHSKSYQIFNVLQSESIVARNFVKFMTLKGQGTPKNVNKARDMFFLDSDQDQISYEMYLILSYLGPSKERKKTAHVLMQGIYDQYIQQKYENQTTQEGEADQNKEFEKMIEANKPKAIETHIMKYMIGSLLISQQIQGDKEEGIYLIHQAAKAGNTLALSYLGLLFLDSSDLSFDCIKSVNYFATEAFSHEYFQTKMRAAEKGLRNNKKVFSLIKYAQLMMIGHKNAFINSYFVLRSESLLELNEESWKASSASLNPHYRFLLSHNIIEPIFVILSDEYNIADQEIINKRNMDKLLMTTQDISKQYLEYMKLKVNTLGVSLHDISILKYYKYLKTDDIFLLHNLANSNNKKLHTLEARYLLAKYYQHSDPDSSDYEKKIERSHRQYLRATQDDLISKLLFFINGHNFTDGLLEIQIVQHLIVYVMSIAGFFIFLNWKRRSNIQQIISQSIYQREQEQKENEKQVTQENKQKIEEQEGEAALAEENKQELKQQYKQQEMIIQENISENRQNAIEGNEILGNNPKETANTNQQKRQSFTKEHQD